MAVVFTDLTGSRLIVSFVHGICCRIKDVAFFVCVQLIIAQVKYSTLHFIILKQSPFEKRVTGDKCSLEILLRVLSAG